MTKLRIGLIGCGFIGRFHSTAIRALIRRGLIDADYVAVCDLDENRARSFASTAGVERALSDPLELIDSPDIDVVYVCVPTSGHKELVLRAAELGKHVFCEKPLAKTLSDTEEMVRALEEAGVKSGVGLVLRHSPILTVLKSMIEDPALGSLMLIVLRDDQFFPIQGHYLSDWRKDRNIAGSGTLLEHSIHDIDLLQWLAGDVLRARGTVRNFAGHDGIEDLATAHLEFEGGAQAQLASVWHSVLGRPSTRRLEVFFENGLFQLDNDFLGPIAFQTHAMTPEVVSEEEVRSRYLQIMGLTDPIFDDLLRYSLEDYFFLRAIAEDRAPVPDCQVALDAHRVVDALYRSAKAGGEDTPLSPIGR